MLRVHRMKWFPRLFFVLEFSVDKKCNLKKEKTMVCEIFLNII